MSKWMEKLSRKTDKYNPRKRKQYKKARYRKQARACEEWCEKEDAKAEELDRLHPDWMAEVEEKLRNWPNQKWRFCNGWHAIK